MILVVGATGTVGRRVIDTLLQNPEIPIRALCRGKNDWEGSLLPGYRRKGVEVIVGDIRSESTMQRAVQDCTGIINCGGLMRAAPEDDLESVNIEGVENLIEQGEKAGVQRFIQLSCMGATEHSTAVYFRSKWSAELAIKKSKFYWTIFRPSLIFDAESSLYRILDFWIGHTPVIFIVGSGLNRFQPISAIDVADCIVKSVYDRETVGKTYELPGPETIDFTSLLSTLAENRGHPFRTLRIPSFWGVPIAGLMGKLNPSCPIDNNVMQVMISEMIGDPKPMMERFSPNQRLIVSSFKPIEKSSKHDDKSIKEDKQDEIDQA